MSQSIPLSHVLVIASVLFALGLGGVLARRNALFMLVGVEVMLNAAGLAFIAVGARRGGADGKVMFVFILVMAAAEVSVGLALLLQLRARLGSLDADAADRMRG